MKDRGTVDDVNDTAGTYSAREVCDIAGVSYRQLDYWVRENIVDADVRDDGDGRPGSGPGFARLFTLDQVCEIRLVARLRELGLSLARANAVAVTVRDSDGCVVLVTKKTVEVVERAEAIERISAGDGAAVIVTPERFLPPV